MAFPKNISEMTSMGYTPTGESLCGKCGAKMAWWTLPSGKKLCYEPGTATPHFKNCGTVKSIAPRPDQVIHCDDPKTYKQPINQPSDTIAITLSRAGAQSLLTKLQEALK